MLSVLSMVFISVAVSDLEHMPVYKLVVFWVFYLNHFVLCYRKSNLIFKPSLDDLTVLSGRERESSVEK